MDYCEKLSIKEYARRRKPLFIYGTDEIPVMIAKYLIEGCNVIPAGFLFQKYWMNQAKDAHYGDYALYDHAEFAGKLKIGSLDWLEKQNLSEYYILMDGLNADHEKNSEELEEHLTGGEVYVVGQNAIKEIDD